jgi:hypothetical protein
VLAREMAARVADIERAALRLGDQLERQLSRSEPSRVTATTIGRPLIA